MNLEKVFNEKTNEYVNSEEFDKKLKETVVKLFDKTLESMIEWNSPIKKALDEKISSSMKTGIEQVGFERLLDRTLSIFEEVINETFEEKIRKAIKQKFQDTIGIEKKEEITLQEIIDQFKKNMVREDEWQGIDCEIEKFDTTSIEVKLSIPDYKASFVIDTEKSVNKIWHFSYKDKSTYLHLDIENKDIPVNMPTRRYGFDYFLYSLWLNQTKIIFPVFSIYNNKDKQMSCLDIRDSLNLERYDYED